MTSVPCGPATRAARGSKSRTSGGQRCELRLAHVGRIADNEVEAALGRQRREQVALGRTRSASATPWAAALARATARAAGLTVDGRHAGRGQILRHRRRR